MDEKSFVQRMFAEAMAASARKSREDLPWTVMQRCAEAMPEAVRGGMRPLDTCLHLLEAILEGFPATLPDDPESLHDNAVHSLARNLLQVLRRAKALQPAALDSVHRAHLDGVADTLRAMAEDLGAPNEPLSAEARAALAFDLGELAKVVRFALQGMKDAPKAG